MSLMKKCSISLVLALCLVFAGCDFVTPVDLMKEQKIQKIENLGAIEQITARLFNHRRKMIRAIIPNVEWERFGLTGVERAENLTPETFALLAKSLL